MRTLIIAAILACGLAAPALASEQRIGVGNEITFRAGPSPYNADIYGCYDLGNTQELEQMRANHGGLIGTPEAMRYDQMIVTNYVNAHSLTDSSHSPLWSNVCIRISSEERQEQYKVAKIFDWPGGGPRLLCLEQMDTLDVRSSEQVEKDKLNPPDPVCWWVNLNRAPALIRLRNGPAAAQHGTSR